MSQRMHVVATEGRSVPMEGAAGTIGSTPTAIINSHYYRRRIAEGDLHVVADPDATPAIATAPSVVLSASDDASRSALDLADGGAPVVADPEQTTTTSRRRATP